ncbi:S-adenosyl-L-methionine-dependent methyltransferase [Rhodocollybia butyracea]|uniref:S-adenosyl-L-methionine-dependent methyltransferase n=1 Tax=Rhodocollybia butyracea TaxID=206335 RepID=A0A9P5UEA6_9AGAR|nr:S-adenosyl-L-methionine-dependent methyltransferase [Rhodocollybia butyracea]
MAGNSPHIEEPPFVSHYVLSYTEDEQERLNWQNRYFTQVLCEGQLIYVPKISLDPGDEVLESATGTGVWLLDVAHKVHPNVSLTGIDISERLFPTQHPRNVTFAVHTVTCLPESWSNRFKLVNQRLLFGALTSEQWGMALSELYRVLKPGGWIQLLESTPDAPSSSSLGPTMKRYTDALAAAFVNKGLPLDLNETLDQRLKDAGFVSVQKRMCALPRLDSQDLDFEFQGLKRLFMASIPVLKPAFLATGMFESEEEIDTLGKDLDQEWDTPSQFLWKYSVAYAQKPDI